MNNTNYLGQLSKCCDYDFETVCGGEGTCFYKCLKCGNPCDVRSAYKDDKSIAKPNMTPLERIKEILPKEIPLRIEEREGEGKELMKEIFGEPVTTPEYLIERRYGHNTCLEKVKDLLPQIDQIYRNELVNKEQIQTSAEYLANLCLENAETYHKYDDKDLVNATLIMTHFLMDCIYKENQGLSFEKQSELAETTGKALRELILSSTGKDMHKLVKSNE